MFCRCRQRRQLVSKELGRSHTEGSALYTATSLLKTLSCSSFTHSQILTLHGYNQAVNLQSQHRYLLTPLKYRVSTYSPERAILQWESVHLIWFVKSIFSLPFVQLGSNHVYWLSGLAFETYLLQINISASNIFKNCYCNAHRISEDTVWQT